MNNIRNNKILSLLTGLVIGVFFGFFLQKGGASNYEVVINQLLLKDFTVLKIMMSAVLVGMLGVHVMKGLQLVDLQPRVGSLGKNIIGPLIFGVGFALLGYCPGTLLAATGSGHLDAFFGGITGMLIGSSLFAKAYPWLKTRILGKGQFKHKTIPELFGVNEWFVVIPVAILILILFFVLEANGL